MKYNFQHLEDFNPGSLLGDYGFSHVVLKTFQDGIQVAIAYCFSQRDAQTIAAKLNQSSKDKQKHLVNFSESEIQTLKELASDEGFAKRIQRLFDEKAVIVSTSNVTF